MVTVSRKKRVKFKEEAEAVQVDRLNSLPDSVLFHILSFLPTEKVVATSILAKRWQNVWRFVDTIDFSRSSYRDEDFARMVYRVMVNHKGECIKRMALDCYGRGVISESDVRSWMSFALDRGVECLTLMLSFGINLPRSLFTSKTLVKLKIAYADITSINVPKAPFLVKLKELRLEDPKCDTESLKRFITGCPTLEFFSLRKENLGVGTWDISSPTLKRLELNSPEPFYTNKIGKILLTTPALQFFRVQHTLSDIIVEDKLSSLVEVDISIAISSDDSCHEIISRFFQLISNVKILQLRTIAGPMISDMHAQFPNLTKLKIVSTCSELILVRIFLEAAMNLEDITISKRYDCQVPEVSWNEPLHVPKCLLSSLKKMAINEYGGGTNELAMVNYVLRNAEVLQMMEIHSLDSYDNNYHYKRKFEMVQEIIKMNRGSKSCQISFC